MPPFENRSLLVALCIDGQPEKEESARQVASANGSNNLEVTGEGIGMNMVLEPKTGIEFPSLLARKHENSSSNSQVLAGVGIKGFSIVKIKTVKLYAFGFYIEPNGLRAQLGGNHKLLSTEELTDDPSVYEEILRHDLEMTVRLVVHYKGLKAGMVRSAFDTSLRNRLKKIKGEEDDEGLHSFNAYFTESLPLSRGTVIDFQRVQGGQLRTEINGKFVGVIHSNIFCRALFDIYIGDPPVSLKAKQDIGEKVFQLLKC